MLRHKTLKITCTDYSTRNEGVLAPLATVGGSGPVSAVVEEPEHTHALQHTVNFPYRALLCVETKSKGQVV
jgi:hypothetical protein